LSTQDQGSGDRQRAWDLLGSVETHPEVQVWLRAIDCVGPGRRRVGRWGVAALAAGALVAVGAGTTAYLHFASPQYETHVGEQRDVLLPDGSRVTLNTNTLLIVRYSKARRYVELQHGEAFFTVKHDALWPFDVAAGGTLTRALGTQFNVDMRSSNVTVSVEDGVVRVASVNGIGPAADGNGVDGAAPAPGELSTVAAAVAKGEAVEVLPRERRAVARQADLRRIDAWRDRRLEFSDMPLPAAIEEFNRYSEIHMVIGSQELKSVRVSGVFEIGDTDGFLYSLKEALRIQALESPGEVTLVRTKS
jgi:transmembrane sensor